MILFGESHAWTFALATLAGASAGYALSWILARQARRVAGERAAGIVELAKREAQVAAAEIRAKTDEELSARRAEIQREQDRRDIEVDVKLREIRNHEESLALLDFQLEARQERLAREAAAIKQGRDAVRAQSKSLRQRLEEISHLDAEEIKKALRDEITI